MTVALRQAWTREEFLLWVEAQEEPYEFDGFQPVAMTRPDNNHGIVVRNIVFALHSRLCNGPCQVLGPEAGITTVGDAVRYPDVLVTCSPIDGRARTVAGPVAVFEVLSPSSLRNDRITKVREYAGVPSIRRYVIVEPTLQGLTVLSRDRGDAPWTATALGEGDVLAMPEIGVELPLDEIYDRIEFD